jgi:phytoene synthase
VPAHARQGRCLLPADLLGAQGLTPERVAAQPDDPRLVPVRAELATWGRGLLRDAGGFLPRALLAAALPAALARRDLRRPEAGPAPRTAADKLAVAGAYLIGRV